MASPQQELVTDHNKSPLIQILAWMFLVIVVLSCIARSGTKLYMVKRLKTEDWFAIVATVSTFSSCAPHSCRILIPDFHQIAACGQYIAHVASGYQGLGKHVADLAEDRIDGALKVCDKRKRRRDVG